MHGITEILSSLEDAIWSYNLCEQEFVYVNNRLAELYETSLDTLTDGPDFWLDHIHPDDEEIVRLETAAVYTGKQIELEYRIIINGKVKWVQDKRAVILSDDNSPKIITGILSDITNKKASEFTFSDTEKTFRYLFVNNPNPLWIYDLKTLKFLAINHAASVKYGYSEKEFLNMTIADIRPQEDVEPLLENVKKVSKRFYNSGKPWRHLKKNGSLMYVDISGHGIKYRGRDAEIVMAHDVTREVESRKKVTLAKKNLDALINNINEDIWSIDAEYRIMSSNISFGDNIERLIGRKLIAGESIFMPEFSLNERQEWKKQYDRALKGETFSFVSRTNATAHPIYVETKMNPIRDNSDIIGVACIAHNIQDRIDTQKKMMEQNKRLLELISIASHEIRGPVASLLGLSQVFNTDDFSDPFNAEIIEHIYTLTNQLDCVIYTLVEKTYSLQQENQLKYFAQRSQSESELP